jgi:hypothetical protein
VVDAASGKADLGFALRGLPVELAEGVRPDFVLSGELSPS